VTRSPCSTSRTRYRSSGRLFWRRAGVPSKLAIIKSKTCCMDGTARPRPGRTRYTYSARTAGRTSGMCLSFRWGAAVVA
jgi:hypothetical protein